MITPVSKRIVNFQCFDNVKFDYAKTGATLILGENGEGKTAFISESFSWCFWGQLLKNRAPDGTTYSSARPTDVIREGTKKCSVKETFLLDGTQYSVVRTKTASTNSLEFLEELNPIEGKNKADLQTKINEKLGMDHTSFFQTNLYGQASKRFVHAKDAERKKILEDLLQLHIYSISQKSVREDRKAVTSRLDTLSTKLSEENAVLRERLDSLNDSKKKYLKLFRDYAVGDSDRQRRLKEAKKKLSTLESDWNKRTDQLKKAVKQLKELDERCLTIDLKETEFKVQNYTRNQLNIIGKLSPLEISLQEAEDNRKQIKKTNTCHVCFRPLETKEALKNLEAKIRELKSNIRFYNSKLQNVVNKKRSYKNKLAEEEAVWEARHPLRLSIKSTEESIKSLQARITDTKTIIKGIENETGAVAPDNQSLKLYKRKILQQIERIRALRSRYAKLSSLEKDYNILDEAFGNQGIKSLIMDSVLYPLNETLSEYLNFLFAGKVRAEFDTQTQLGSGDLRDKINLNVFTQKGQGYHRLSGGQRARFDFCVALALQTLQRRKFNLLVLDEPFESVDSEGTVDIVDLLQEFSLENNVPVYVVSHNQSLKSQFANTIRISMNRFGTATVEV